MPYDCKVHNYGCSIFRLDWELAKPKKWNWVRMKPLQTTVVVHYNSHSDTCTWFDHCVEMMQQLHKRYLAMGLPDMPYNFVVGCDGEAYGVRGWKKESDPCLPYPELVGKKIDVLLMGEWSDTEPPAIMRDRLAKLIDFGAKYGRLAKDYQLLTVDNKLWDQYNNKFSHILIMMAHNFDLRLSFLVQYCSSAKQMEFDVLPRFVTRTTWGAEPPATVHHHQGPMEHVCFNYNTGTEPCNGDTECFPVLRKLQKDFMDQGLSDIPYSFLVGGDGTIYEGRGWHVRTSSIIHGPTMSPRLDIGFLGAYHRDTVPKKMYFKSIDWVYYGVRMNLLLRMYSFQENRLPPRLKRGTTYKPQPEKDANSEHPDKFD